MLAVFGSATYSTAIHKLEESDRIVMHTDGILEASNSAGKSFGEDTLYDLLTKTSVMPGNGGRLDHLFSPAMVAKAG